MKYFLKPGWGAMRGQGTDPGQTSEAMKMLVEK